MQIAAAVSRDVWPRMGGAQYPPDGKGHPTCTIRRNTLAGIIYCCTNGATPRRVPPRVPVPVLRLSPFDFLADDGVSSSSSSSAATSSATSVSWAAVSPRAKLAQDEITNESLKIDRRGSRAGDILRYLK